ncbi:MAG: UDP-3-O-(3-hydroxymyristoyl)glucosamine N-acyltransferase [Pseudomonadota bacterium]
MGTTVQEIATALQATVFGDGTLEIDGLAEPQSAGPRDLALAMSPKFAATLQSGNAIAAVVWADADWQSLGLQAAIVAPRPRLTMAGLTQIMDVPVAATGFHPTAVIHETAEIAADASIGAFCVIGAKVKIGPGTRLADHVSVENDALIGESSLIHAGVRIGRNVTIGDRVVLQPNVVIGADGFSFVTATPSIAETGPRTLGKSPLMPIDDPTQHKIHSLGSVVIGDDVEVGANTTVDAGTIRATQIGNGTKIDNLVQVGHNVIVGQDCLLCAQAAIAGSTTIGDRTILGGKSGVADNVKIGQDCLFGGAAIALADVPDGSFIMGYPAKPMLAYRAEQRALRDAAKSR